MKLFIDTGALQQNNVTLDEFLILLGTFAGVNWRKARNSLVKKDIIAYDLITSGNYVISDNVKQFVMKVLVESSPKLKDCPINDFEALTQELIDIYPKGTKTGTTYNWAGSPEEVALKLRMLVAVHDFIFTPEEAIKATQSYVDNFPDADSRIKMRLLTNFILKGNGDGTIDSDFMTTIENMRDEVNN